MMWQLLVHLEFTAGLQSNSMMKQAEAEKVMMKVQVAQGMCEHEQVRSSGTSSTCRAEGELASP